MTSPLQRIEDPERQRTPEEELVAQHLAWLYALGFRLCQDETLAVEATAEAFARTFCSLKAKDNRDRPFRLLLTEHLIDYLRPKLKGTHAKIRSFDQELNLRKSVPMEQRALLGMIVAGLRKLPFEKRAALLLRDLGHLTHDSIADIVKIPRQDIRRHLLGIRMELQQMLTAPFSPKK